MSRSGRLSGPDASGRELATAAAAIIEPGPVLLTGYSQGSIIAPAVVAQLPPDVLPDTTLLTLACPARRLYGRAFPAFFRPDHLETLAELLTGDTTRQWTNVVRRSD